MLRSHLVTGDEGHYSGMVSNTWRSGGGNGGRAHFDLRGLLVAGVSCCNLCQSMPVP